MKLSKQAAIEVGAMLAQQLHSNGNNTFARGAVLHVRDGFLDALNYETRVHLRESWNKQLDLLEPLSAPRGAR
jgi:hypothetical protein